MQLAIHTRKCMFHMKCVRRTTRECVAKRDDQCVDRATLTQRWCQADTMGSYVDAAGQKSPITADLHPKPLRELGDRSGKRYLAEVTPPNKP